MKRTLTTLFLTLTALYTAVAGPSYSFRHLNISDGLSSNTVRSMIQDHRGLIWIGTADGLDSFDGREVIHHEFSGAGANYVNCLWEDAAQTLWAGTDDGLYCYNGLSMQKVESAPSIAYTCMAEDSDGALWLGTFDQGIYRLRKGAWSHYLAGQGIEALRFTADGRLWAATQSAPEGLYLYNASTEDFTPPSFTYNNCTPARICALEEDGAGNLWLGTWDKGIYRLDPSTRTICCAVSAQNGLTRIHSLLQENSRNLLAGSDDGLFQVDPFTGESTLYTNDRNIPRTLSNKFVYPLLKDHENGLWIGTYYGGVNYVAPGNGLFQSHSLSDLTDAQEDYAVSCFCEDPDGSIWMGSDNGGLFRYNPASGQAAPWAPSKAWEARFSALNIHALLRQGDWLWIGNYPSRTLRVNLKTKAIIEYEPLSIYAFYLAGDGTLWAGNTSDIWRYNAAEDRFVPEKNIGEGVSAIVGDAAGTLWFGTTGKGVLVRHTDGSWEELNSYNSIIPNDHVNHLMLSNGTLCVSTRRGFAVLNPEDPQVLLPKTNVCFAAYSTAQLWLSSSKTLLRYGPRENPGLERYQQNDGVFTEQYMPGAGLVTRDGHVYMGAANGFVTFYPGAVPANPPVPNVLFTRFYASAPGINEDVFRSQGDKGIRLPFRMRNLTIGFAAPTFSVPEKVHYMYKLDGGDGQWMELGNQNWVSLSLLPSRHYRLHIKARNNGGPWNDGAVLEFQIKPHPLLSNVAIVLYILLGGLMVWLALLAITQHVERKTEILIKGEEQDDRKQMLSDLADQLEAPVTGIGLQVKKLKGGLPSPELTAIDKNQRMLRQIVGNLRQIKAEGPAAGESAAPDAVSPEGFMARLDRLISENLANPDLSVAFLSKEMAISRSGLFAKVKEYTGETPNNLISQARLNTAANLLAQGKHSVGEICYMTGFSSPSYFSKVFAAQFGMTPHDWAKKQAAFNEE